MKNSKDKNREVLVLDADDSEGTRFTTSRMLETADYRIKEAVNGKEAVSITSEIVPDIVAPDVHLPDIS
jgi:response regulator RpfG family c-di-GMP phosphodiesterase